MILWWIYIVSDKWKFFFDNKICDFGEVNFNRRYVSLTDNENVLY